MNPTTTVVICSRGRPDLLLDAVDSVLGMRRLPTELVVVDQSGEAQAGLADGTVQNGTAVAITYMWSPGRGLSRARNAGLAAAGGEIVAFLDDDMLVVPDWLDSLVGALTAPTHDPDRHVISGQVRAGRPEVPGAWASSTISDPRARSYSGRLNQDVLFAGNMALYRSAFDVVGTFDERLGAGTSLPGAEDNDFGYRLLEAGFTIDYVPDAVAVHRAWRQGSDRHRLKYEYGRGQGGFYGKHISRGDWFIVRRLVADVLRHVVRAAVRMLRARPREARRDLAYTYGVIAGAGSWFRQP